jgi:hypothetical protein
MLLRVFHPVICVPLAKGFSQGSMFSMLNTPLSGGRTEGTRVLVARLTPFQEAIDPPDGHADGSRHLSLRRAVVVLGATERFGGISKRSFA